MGAAAARWQEAPANIGFPCGQNKRARFLLCGEIDTPFPQYGRNTAWRNGEWYYEEISVVQLKVAGSQTFNALLSVLDSSQFIN